MFSRKKAFNCEQLSFWTSLHISHCFLSKVHVSNKFEKCVRSLQYFLRQKIEKSLVYKNFINSEIQNFFSFRNNNKDCEVFENFSQDDFSHYFLDVLKLHHKVSGDFFVSNLPSQTSKKHKISKIFSAPARSPPVIFFNGQIFFSRDDFFPLVGGVH